MKAPCPWDGRARGDGEAILRELMMDGGDIEFWEQVAAWGASQAGPGNIQFAVTIGYRSIGTPVRAAHEPEGFRGLR